MEKQGVLYEISQHVTDLFSFFFFFGTPLHPIYLFTRKRLVYSLC